MTIPTPLDVVKEFSRRTVAAADLTELQELVSDDIDWFVVGDAGVVPWAGRSCGKTGASQFYATLRRETTSERFEVKDILTQANRVAVIGELATRVKRTGKLVEFEFVFDYIVENGLIVRFRPFEDNEAIAKGFI